MNGEKIIDDKKGFQIIKNISFKEKVLLKRIQFNQEKKNMKIKFEIR